MIERMDNSLIENQFYYFDDQSSSELIVMLSSIIPNISITDKEEILNFIYIITELQTINVIDYNKIYKLLCKYEQKIDELNCSEDKKIDQPLGNNDIEKAGCERNIEITTQIRFDMDPIIFNKLSKIKYMMKTRCFVTDIIPGAIRKESEYGLQNKRNSY